MVRHRLHLISSSTKRCAKVLAVMTPMLPLFTMALTPTQEAQRQETEGDPRLQSCK